MKNRTGSAQRFCARLSVAVLTISTVGLTATISAAAEAGESDPAPPPKDSTQETLGSHDEDLLAQAVAKGTDRVTLIVAAEPDKTAAVVEDLTALGGKIGKQAARVGYVRVQVPTSQVLTAADLPGVMAIDLDETIPLPDPEPSTDVAADAARVEVAVAGPGLDTPADNPFMPTGETGSVEFKAAHPTWDGRGVTIGILDSGVDLDNPALQTTSTGERKIVDWFTATDPVFDSDATWRLMLTAVSGPAFSYAGATWTAPAGSFLVNRFNEAITSASEPGGDVNRDGDTTDVFGVLYDPATHDIWVDVNQNNDFTDDAKMRPYAEKFDVGHFGQDNPDTAVRDQMPFTVEYREDVDLSPYGLPGTADFVNIGIVEDAHGSHVAGITAANDMYGNADFDGQAPGATLVSARACTWGGGCTAAALTDGLVELVVNRNVDVVNISIGGLPALNDGNNARAKLYNQLIDVYGVQIFISAGNSGPGVNTVGDPGVISDVVSVAAANSAESWLANYGSVVAKPYDLTPFSSRGPREDGGFKPNITAPGSAISTTPQWLPGVPVPESGYTLPPGYSMFQGTSMASPQAAGVAALLLSAAIATDRGITPAALRRALYSSATWIDGVAADGQGNGRIEINGAWNLLEAGVETRSYTSVARVCTPLSDFLQTPDRGVGIYNRCAAGEGGVPVGQPRNLWINLTRTTGPDQALWHQLSWLGNDGTFRSAPRVLLPLNRTVAVKVRVEAGEGSHSAVLRVDDPSTPAVDYEVLNTVVASKPLKAPAYERTAEGSIDRNDTTSYFVTVPEGAKALQVNMAGIATGSQVRFIAIDPYGVPADLTSTPLCYPNYSDPATCKPQERSYENPLPGLWEIEVEARRTSPMLSNPYRLTARIQGVEVNPEVVELPSVGLGEPSEVTWTLTNRFGPVIVTPIGGPLGSSATERPSIAQDEVKVRDVVVPAGASSLDVTIGNPSDPGSDLDLYVEFNDVVIAQSADGDAEESVSIPNPVAGTYQIRIQGYAVPSGATDYDYRDVFYSPALGQVAMPAVAQSLPYGGTTTVTGTVTAAAAPAAGRQLFGQMSIVTDEGALVGTGQVVIGAID